jgi:hypothetical protein
VRDKLLDAGALAPIHVEERAAVFRITPLAAEDHPSTPAPLPQGRVRQD